MQYLPHDKETIINTDKIYSQHTFDSTIHRGGEKKLKFPKGVSAFVPWRTERCSIEKQKIGDNPARGQNEMGNAKERIYYRGNKIPKTQKQPTERFLLLARKQKFGTQFSLFSIRHGHFSLWCGFWVQTNKQKITTKPHSKNDSPKLKLMLSFSLRNPSCFLPCTDINSYDL